MFFSRAVLEAIRLLDLPVDMLHANDWQTGLVPAYLKVLYAGDPRYQKIASLFAIHNMAYQGQFWHWDMLLTGLDWKYFNWHQMEFHGKLNLLKTGMVFADAIVTVSPRYAQEIQSAPLGCGLEGVLQYRREVLSGILNGIDESEWNPATDRHLAERYNVSTVRPRQGGVQGGVAKGAWPAARGRRAAGRLRRPLGRAERDRPDRRGRAALGANQRRAMGGARHRAAEVPQAVRGPRRSAFRTRSPCGWSSPTRWPTASRPAADMFLMPSRYEPCGLNQMYSLKYGTVPIVRETGGLADTIVGYGGPHGGIVVRPTASASRNTARWP